MRKNLDPEKFAREIKKGMYREFIRDMKKLEKKIVS
jgi:hypothetical protein